MQSRIQLYWRSIIFNEIPSRAQSPELQVCEPHPSSLFPPPLPRSAPRPPRPFSAIFNSRSENPHDFFSVVLPLCQAWLERQARDTLSRWWSSGRGGRGVGVGKPDGDLDASDDKVGARLKRCLGVLCCETEKAWLPLFLVPCPQRSCHPPSHSRCARCSSGSNISPAPCACKTVGKGNACLMFSHPRIVRTPSAQSRPTRGVRVRVNSY